MIDWYSPAYKAGGPIQSCRNLVHLLSPDVDFYIYTGDRDLGDQHPFDGIKFDRWVEGPDGVKVWYASRSSSAGHLKSLISALAPDVVYLNSMFSVRFTLSPLWVLHNMRYHGRIVIAPRGMLHEGARSFKAFKKNVFLFLFDLYNKSRQFTFQATDLQEASDIRRALPSAKRVVTIGNIPRLVAPADQGVPKNRGELRMVFLSRIHPKKNLIGLINLLSQPFTGKVCLDIYGGVEDPAYAQACREAALRVPVGVSVQFKDPVPHSDVAATLQNYHLFVLLTKGENFGHAIFESFSCGLPVLISRHTPWQGLQDAKAGWIVDSSDAPAAEQIINEVLQMDQMEFNEWRKGAVAYAKAYIEQGRFREDYSNLFS
jgi:glycosyltransferase involved in cell wall biosynthesis